MVNENKQEKKPEIKRETVVLKNDTLIGKQIIKAGTQIEATAGMKKLLRPFGYCESNRESGDFIRKDS